jgi:hypothetical protein
MSTLTKEQIKAISIEYRQTEQESDVKKPLVVGQGLMPNFYFTEDLGYKTFFGVKRYMTGLDTEIVKYDPELTDEEKEKKIKEIEETLSRLEKFFGPGTLDATNEKHWSKVKLTISRKTTNLNLTDPKNEIIFHCIKGGGFEIVAPNYELCEKDNKKFYLVEPTEFVEHRVAPRELNNRAVSILQKLYENKGFDDIFYIGKFILPVEKSYTKRTPKALIYEDLDKFLNGEVVKKAKVACSRELIEATKMPKADLVISCIVKDALHYGFLYTNPSGELKNNETGGIYGTSVEKTVSHLQNPAYEHELDNLKTRIEKKWSE